MCSEIARLRKQLELDAASLLLLSTGFKMTASHEIIDAAYEQLGAHQEQLGKLIGEQEAASIVIMVLGGPNKAERPCLQSDM